METLFKLVQVSKPKNVKLEPLNNDSFSFEAKVEMEQDRFDALFDYCKHNWDEIKIAEIEHDGLNEDGEPINPIFKGIRLNKL